MNRIQSLLLLLELTVVFAACGGTGSENAAVTPKAPVFDSALTDQARIYAGMLPLDSARYRNLTSGKAFAVHRELFEKNWAQLDKRLQAMETWRAKELSGISTAGATLFYPFSGPDFLNADVFFPGCAQSVYISLEKAGETPPPDMDEEHFLNFTEDIRKSLSNIFVRDYFVTRRMIEQFHTPFLQGNLTVFFVFLARRSYALMSVRKVHIDSAGSLVEATRDTGIARKKQIGGIELRYVKLAGDSAVRRLYYFPVDIQDSALELKPQLQRYLGSLDNVIMFTKAASYCLHGKNFSIIRELCLHAKAVLEDDTGIPYRFFTPGKWAVNLYGNYTKPIKDFNYGFQKDLEKAFGSQKNVHPLSFNIGYHWQDSYSSLILAVRQSPDTSAPAPDDTLRQKR
jgi:hypothetical protein